MISVGFGSPLWELNSQGQVALNVSIDGGPTMLVLLTANVP